MLNRTLVILLLVINYSVSFSQGRSSVWCFGDSAGLDFSTNQPSTFISGVKSRGSCFSISDEIGSLLFYGFTRATLAGNTTLVFDSNNSLMMNGSNIVGQGWYLELLSFPFPNDSTKYYVFSVGTAVGGPLLGLYYSVVDISLNNGLGAVTQKNVQLRTEKSIDCISAVKHGNGRDWWLFFKHYDNSNNAIYKYLITPTGISGPFVQNIGVFANNGFIWIIPDNSGERIALINYLGRIETMSFDRCSGLFSNYRLIRNNDLAAPYSEFVGGTFSKNGQFLYLSTNGSSSDIKLMQLIIKKTPKICLGSISSHFLLV